ncbi:hypothetical protein SDC9_09010 [bioreactor metagenome]|uniref:bis(5'-nucleosyl)-tetraphosphatase (symmetrical) n=1 Tax=bioreactor metagenome TaxID=1076179 RepID=A0A644T8W6_9ZZZZ|nr:bis(5'-nucleosyl)-tetraphosphatase (symmetrical) YqeK [Negativicutes bacterium]
MQYQEIIDRLTVILTKKRMDHSRGVSQTAVLLARRFGADESKAALAGILHDCAREIPRHELITEAVKWKIAVGTVECQEPVLLHAPLGAKMAEKQYGIRDQEVLNAIKLHTLGGPSMSILAKIIYLADFIEPGRSFSGVDKLRALAEVSLDTALLAAYDYNIEYIIKKGGLIHPTSVEGRNELLIHISK